MPVYINIEGADNFSNELLMYSKIAFKNFHIRTISKADLNELVRAEGERLTKSYYDAGGNMGNFEKLKSYYSQNRKPIANHVTINVAFDSTGKFPDSARWNTYTLPINLEKQVQINWNTFKFIKNSESTPLTLTQQLVDAIVNSKNLAIEK